MFHKNVSPVANSIDTLWSVSTHTVNSSSQQTPATPTRLKLVPSGGGVTPQKRSSALFDLLAASAYRCSTFFAEAAVLVLVLALLDRFMLKGHLESNWVIGAVTLSVLLLAASIATDFSARRWLQRH
jgi:general stress protein CsbA